MKDGIYYVVFRSNNQNVGNGTVVVKNNTVNGGDFGYTYKGNVVNSVVNLNITQHDKSAPSVLGNIINYSLNLNIESASWGYHLQGNVVGMPSVSIQANAKFIGDLA